MCTRIRLCHFLPTLASQTSVLELMKWKLIPKTVFLCDSCFHRAANPKSPKWWNWKVAMLQGWRFYHHSWFQLSLVLGRGPSMPRHWCCGCSDGHTQLSSRWASTAGGYLGQEDLWCPSSYLTWSPHFSKILKLASGLGSLLKDFLPLLGPPQSTWHIWWLNSNMRTGSIPGVPPAQCKSMGENRFVGDGALPSSTYQNQERPGSSSAKTPVIIFKLLKILFCFLDTVSSFLLQGFALGFPLLGTFSLLISHWSHFSLTVTSS